MGTIAVDKPTIMIVDDTPSNIQVLAEALRGDYRIKVAGSGKMALEIISKQGVPDLILLDVMMPEMDGYNVCAHLKNAPATRDVPIIFVTAKTDYDDEEYGLKLGAVDYVTKPFHLPIVLARVRNHINLKLKSDLLETYAQIDALTNIPNRRRFDEILNIEWKRALRTGSLLSLIVLDIDYFKFYNDNYGHGAGDICLRKVASALAEIVTRSGDLIARYGGEEFVALLPNTDEDGALKIAERMRSHVEAMKIPHGHSLVSSWVTISAGLVSAVPQTDESSTSLFNKADEMLYHTKQSGRNKISCWSQK